MRDGRGVCGRRGVLGGWLAVSVGGVGGVGQKPVEHRGKLGGVRANAWLILRSGDSEDLAPPGPLYKGGRGGRYFPTVIED